MENATVARVDATDHDDFKTDTEFRIRVRKAARVAGADFFKNCSLDEGPQRIVKLLHESMRLISLTVEQKLNFESVRTALFKLVPMVPILSCSARSAAFVGLRVVFVVPVACACVVFVHACMHACVRYGLLYALSCAVRNRMPGLGQYFAISMCK